METTNPIGIGWVTPKGEYLPCHVYDHLDQARKLCSAYHIPCEPHTADDALIKNGWFKITRSDFTFEWHIIGGYFDDVHYNLFLPLKDKRLDFMTKYLFEEYEYRVFGKDFPDD